MSSTSFHSTAMRYWKKKTNATFGIDDEKELVQVVLLQILGGDGS